MGKLDLVIENYYKKIPSKYKVAFVSAMITGLIAHMYMFTNKLPNYDDIRLNSFGATFRLGRWFLWVLGAILYHLDLVYSLPWINGMVSLLFLAVSASMIVKLLNVESNATIVIISGLLVVFPSWTATFFFMYTAPYYAFSVFLAVLSVYCVVYFKHGFIAGVVLLTLSLGIYQAYLPFAAALYVVILMLTIWDKSIEPAVIIRNAIKYFLSLVLGVALYYILMRVSLIITGQELADYKGVSKMGLISAENIKNIFEAIIFNGFGVFWNNNLEISYNLILKSGYLMALVITIVCIFLKAAKLIKDKETTKCILLILLLCAYVLAVNSIYIMSPEDGAVYSIMTYAYAFLLILPICLLDKTLTERYAIIEYISKAVLLCIVLSYCHFANAQYLSIDLSLKQATGYFNTMITQIKSVDGYTDKLPVAFIGDTVNDDTLYRNDVMDIFDFSGRDDVLVDAYSRDYLLAYYCGFSPIYAQTDELNMQEINKMPCYPVDGSIRIVDDVIIIKLSDEN